LWCLAVLAVGQAGLAINAAYDRTRMQRVAVPTESGSVLLMAGHLTSAGDDGMLILSGQL
jgi:hypothetical protein